MTKTLIITGSPSGTSRTAKLAHLVGTRLAQAGIDSSLLDVRSLPAEDLLNALDKNPYLKVFVAMGYYDMATPYYAV